MSLVILICAWDTSVERPLKITSDFHFQCLSQGLQFDKVHYFCAYTRSVQFGSILNCVGFTRA